MAQQQHTTREPSEPASPSGASRAPGSVHRSGPDLRPERFGRYVLLNQLGAGGMAEVFRAVVTGPQEFQRVFVVKRILPRLCADPAFVKMFIDEATLCGRLSHPNIIQVHEFGQQARRYFIAMEFVHGRTLAQILRRLAGRSLPFTIAAEILRQACHGLAYAHALTAADGRPLGIVHRDVSPGNVIVAHNGAVKMLDFGIARVEDRFRLGDTQPGQIKGKSAYLAPEQITSKSVDYRADIFAAGILLYEMITGRRLFKAANPLECMNLITSLRVPLPSQVNPDVPARLESIVLRALRRKPEERFQSAHEMADELESFLFEQRHSSRDLPLFMADLFHEEKHDKPYQLTPDEVRAVQIATGQAPRITTEYPVARPSPTSAMRAQTGESSGSDAFAGGHTKVVTHLPRWHRQAWLATAALVAFSAVVVVRSTVLRPQTAAAPQPPAPLIAPERAPRPTAAQTTVTATTTARPPAAITLTIASDPPGAAVFEMGKDQPLGLTPMKLTRTASLEPLTYRLSRTGYAEGVLQVVPDADKARSLSLTPLRKPAPPEPGARRNVGRKVRGAVPIDPFQP